MQKEVLIVEDDEHLLFLLKHMLQRGGYVVRDVPDGHSAEHIIATERPPALVLLDIMLPKVDGFQLIARIRNDPAWQHVPIIMLSANSHESDVVRALDAGADDYVTKPFRSNELLARIQRLLQRTRHVS